MIESVEQLKGYFPRLVKDPDYVYLDTGATALKPSPVIDAVTRFYQEHSASVHRGVYADSEYTTSLFEKVRAQVQNWIGASQSKEIIFTSGTTAALNLVAQSLGGTILKSGDAVLVTQAEHHANIVPWFELCKAKDARLVVCRVHDNGTLDEEHFESLLSHGNVKICALTLISNVTGIRNNVEKMTRLARDKGAVTVIDAAQAMLSERINVEKLGCDLLAFSSHKMFGPSGTGVLWGKYKLLQSMKPFLLGGAMIRSVSFERILYDEPPGRFEAGTPNIEGVLGLGAAIDFLSMISPDFWSSHKYKLLTYAAKKLNELSDVKLIGAADQKSSPIFSFTLEGIHPHDIGTLLDQKRIAVRAGHHCAEPLMKRFGAVATVRASLSLYNTPQDIDRLIEGLEFVREVFAS